MINKKEQLKRRLDAINKELQSLYDQVSARGPKGDWEVAPFFFPKHEPNPSTLKYSFLPNKTNKSKKVTEKGGNTFQDNQHEEYKRFLKSISSSLAKGSDAVHRIASLTEVTSLPDVSEHLGYLGKAWDGCGKAINNGTRIYNQPVKLTREDCWPKRKSILFENKHQRKHETNSRKEKILNEMEKLIKIMDSPDKPEVKPTTPPTKDSDEILHGVVANGQQVDEKMVELNLLKDKLCAVKKKLQNEKEKRENAEKAIAGYRRRLAALEGKSRGKEKQTENPEENVNEAEKEDRNTKTLQEQLKHELKTEHAKRKAADKAIKELQMALRENERKLETVEQARLLALEMAETYHEQRCKHDPKEIERLKFENKNLEKKLKQMRSQEEKPIQPALISSLLERAERAEKELIEKMKECTNLISRCSINDPEVQELLEKHKAAYRELEKEKESKERELVQQAIVFKKEIEAVKIMSAEEYEDLNEMYKNSLRDLNKKEVALQTILSGKETFETEISNLKKRLSNAFTLNENQEATIKGLNEKLLMNSEKLENLQYEYEENKKLFQSSLEEKIKELNDAIADKENTVQHLKDELEKEKDTVRIKDKMLQDQLDTMKCLRTVNENMKKTLDDERAQKNQLSKEIDVLLSKKKILESKLSAYEKQLEQEKQVSLSMKEKNNESITALETMVSSDSLKELEKRLIKMEFEKDQAVKTAKFATEKLVKAINDYEFKLSIQKNLYNALIEAYNEKQFELEVANGQLCEMNEELWRSAKSAEDLKKKFQSRLWKACAVCADVIDAQIQKDL